jgi:hypothetical protein
MSLWSNRCYQSRDRSRKASMGKASNVNGSSTRLRALWAPLDYPRAARPVLAVWLNEAKWRCLYEVRHAVGAKAPLGHLPVSWRFVTLLALSDIFGAELDGVRAISDIASRIMLRATSWRNAPYRRHTAHSSPIIGCAVRQDTRAWPTRSSLTRIGSPHNAYHRANATRLVRG